MEKFSKKYDEIITVDNLLSAWRGFLCGKKKRNDVIAFQSRLMDNLLNIFYDLKEKIYKHGEYKEFHISDPKPRVIHKATVRDRLIHHLLYQETYNYFDNKFIYDSYSCRLDKGTHRAIKRFNDFARKVSKNNHRTAWVLKCDIKKFFASIDHEILKNILSKYIEDENLLWLLARVIDSFETKGKNGVGLPLGNLTSQLLVNIYMNEFDQFVKRDLKIKYYIRFADDFIFLSENEKELSDILAAVDKFLKERLKLSLHPNKVFIETMDSGVDFLGWVNFSEFKILRRTTRRRMMKNMENNPTKSQISSYVGLLKHGNSFKLKKAIKNNKIL